MTQLLVVAFGGFAIRLWLILTFPVVFGNDSMIRLVNDDKILMSYQLPFLPVFIFLLSKLSTAPQLVRLALAAIGKLAGTGFHLFTLDLVDRRAGFLVALLFTANPLIVAISTMPYQESLMLTGLFFAFHFFFHERWISSDICLGLACLTRFEAWIACPILMFVYAWHGHFGIARWCRALMIFGLVQLMWILLRGSLSPIGSFVIDYSISWRRFERLAYLGWIMAKNTPIPALFVAGGGFVLIIMQRHWQLQRIEHAQRMQRAERIQIVAAFTLFFLAAVLFSAHGESPDPDRRVTLREAHIPMAVVILLSAFVFARVPRVTAVLCGLGIILGIRGSYRFVQRETSKPENCPGYEVARYLDRNAGLNDDVLIMAAPISNAALNSYLERAREHNGEAGFRAAQDLLATMDTTPLDFQRTLIHSRLGRKRLWPYPQLPKKADWVAVWYDFVPFERRSAEWLRIAHSPPTAMVRSLDRAVNIYHFASTVQK